jgi:hypothetical protein
VFAICPHGGSFDLFLSSKFCQAQLSGLAAIEIAIHSRMSAKIEWQSDEVQYEKMLPAQRIESMRSSRTIKSILVVMNSLNCDRCFSLIQNGMK